MGQKKSSDPYVKISKRAKVAAGREVLCKTAVIKKSLNPTWDETFKITLEGRKFDPLGELLLAM